MLPGIVVYSQETRENLFRAIDSSDILLFEELMKDMPVDTFFREDNLDPLSYAIIRNEPEIVQLLLEKNADLSKLYRGYTPLMWAARMRNDHILRLLVKVDHDINRQDASGNTALVYAAAGGCLECVKILTEWGADPGIVNNNEINALSFAQKMQFNITADYLRLRMLEIEGFSKNLIDGPHIEWISEKRVKLKYFQFSSDREEVKIFIKRKKVPGSSIVLDGNGLGEGNYFVEKKIEVQDDNYDKVKKIFMIGDIHGNYTRLVSILRNSGIVDENLNWNWGSGHLLLIGDVFDKGENVTDILWFIKLIQHQAGKEGGRVHLLFGNHEVMNLKGDNRYLSDESFFLMQRADVPYSSLFYNNHELGRWLRSLNTIIKINDILFVHGGISPELLDLRLSAGEVNQKMRNYLSGEGFGENDSIYNFLLGENGPLWYRGYLLETKNSGLISSDDLKKILDFYKVKKIIYGHTSDSEFRFGYDNRTICLDVSVKSEYEGEQALLYHDGKMYKVFSDGKKELLF